MVSLLEQLGYIKIGEIVNHYQLTYEFEGKFMAEYIKILQSNPPPPPPQCHVMLLIKFYVAAAQYVFSIVEYFYGDIKSLL